MGRSVGRFDGKVALVTGAASGIGRASAERLAAEGARVVACDMNAAGAAETRDRILAEGGTAQSHPADLSTQEPCRAAVAATLDHFGQLDVLCNIAGILISGRVTDFSEVDWNRILAVNLSSVFFLSQAGIPHLIETHGVIVNLSSSAGLVGQAYTSPYSATKAAVVSLTKSMALEYGKQGVRVNCVCPGAVLTPMTKGFTLPEDADPDLVRKLAPLTKIASPQEIAGAVAYLASPEARYVNGAALAIDGGQTAG